MLVLPCRDFLPSGRVLRKLTAGFPAVSPTDGLASVVVVRAGPFKIGQRFVLVVLLVSLAGLAAACSDLWPATAPLRPPPEPPPQRSTASRHPRVHKPVRLVVAVIDGDRWRRVRHARVRLWGRSARTDRHGVAEIRVPWRKPLYVTIAARGYGTRTLLQRFARSRRVTLRLYRRDLQWPLYGATASRTQAQTHIRLRPPFRAVWARDLGGLIEFPATVADGVAYIGNNHATVRAIKMGTGAVLWRHLTPRGKMASSPAVVGRELVYHSMNGHVYVLDRASGRRRWSYGAGAAIESSPIVRGGVDYFGAWNGRVYALDLRRHRLRWSRRLGEKITSSAALAGRTIFIGDYGRRIWALSARTGATRWMRSVDGRVYGTPAVAAGRVFVPSSDGDSLTAFSTRGRRLWRIGTHSYVYSSPAVWGGRVFFGAYNGVFYGVSAASGRIVWRVQTGGPISGAAVVVDGVAYAGSFAHRIVGVNARTGRVLLRFRHGEYVPVSGNGMELLFHGYTTLYAMRPRAHHHPRHRPRHGRRRKGEVR
jgi:outer membrane protein assembly factor BamB